MGTYIDIDLYVPTKEHELGFEVRIVDGVARKYVSDLAEEIVAEEGKTRSVGQDDHAKVRVQRNQPSRCVLRGDRFHLLLVVAVLGGGWRVEG